MDSTKRMEVLATRPAPPYPAWFTSYKRRSHKSVLLYVSGLLISVGGGVAVLLYGDASQDMLLILIVFFFALVPLASILGILLSARPTPAIFVEKGIVAPTVLLDQVLHDQPELIPYHRIDGAVRQAFTDWRGNSVAVMMAYRNVKDKARMIFLGEGRDFPLGAADRALEVLSARGVATSRIDGPLVPSLRRKLKQERNARR